MPLLRRLVAVLSVGLAACGWVSAAQPEFKLPPGFEVQVLAEDIPSARSMVWGDAGTLFVATRRSDRVYAVRNALAAEPEVLEVATGLKTPNGVAFRDGDLYVAEPKRILVLRGIESRLDDPPAPAVAVPDLLFKNGLHAWKYIAFGPDGRLYVPFGAPCNVCDQDALGSIKDLTSSNVTAPWSFSPLIKRVGVPITPYLRPRCFTSVNPSIMV